MPDETTCGIGAKKSPATKKVVENDHVVNFARLN
jgi:hypothetical protein